jgi:hypothetical protein
MAAPKPTSTGRRGLELRNTWQRRNSPLGEAESGAMGHMAAPKPTSIGRRGPELRNARWRRSSTQQGDDARGHGPRGSTRAHLSKEVRSGVVGHVAAPNPTSAGRCQLKLQLTWQRVNTRPAPYLDLELVCGGTRSSGCRQRPSGPPQERLRTCKWGQFFGAPLGYLDLFTRQSTAGPQEVLELKFWEHPPLTRKHRRQTSEGAGAEGPGVTTINVKTSTGSPREVLELKVRERPPSM